MKIGNFDFESNNKTFIVAELSCNHKQDLDIAIKTIRAIKESGADAVKIQTYTPDTITINCNNEHFKINEGLWKGRTLYDLYKEAYTPWDWHETIFKVAKEENLICFSSPFDKTAVDFLENYNTPAYKIASFEIKDIPLIEYVASKGKPIIISTGIAEYGDIALAVDTCRKVSNNNIILLKCTSAYPAPISEANLATIPSMKKNFNVEVGLSDHTLGIIAPIVSISLGARLIEKHFILDKAIGGPDVAFSLDKNEFTKMVMAVREAEKAIGTVNFNPTESVKSNIKFSRSLFVTKNVKAGEIFTPENVRSIRPGYGLPPKELPNVLNKRASKDITMGTPLSWDLIQ